MVVLQLFLLAIIGVIGIIFNWLLVLAIQRKTYHYQHSQRIPSPVHNKSLLRPPPSTSESSVPPPLLPSARSCMSVFDKFILAFLMNDIFVCNFLLPLRFIDLSLGLPCGFLCFMLRFLEKLTTIIELIIINLLLISTLIFFWRQRLLTRKLWSLYFLFMMPILLGYLISTLTHLDVDEYSHGDRPSTCKQSFIYINLTTQESLNMFCCVTTYSIIVISFGLLVKMQLAIKAYKQNSLRNFTEMVTADRQDMSVAEQVIRM